MSNRFSALLSEEDEEDVRPTEVAADAPEPAPLIGTIIAPAMAVSADDGMGWEKAEGRKHKKTLKSKVPVIDPLVEAFALHKKLHAACMREYAVQVELRCLYQTLVQEWSDASYDFYGHVPKRTPHFRSLLKHKFIATTGFNATVEPNVERVDGCCGESWDYHHIGWTIVVPTQFAKIPALRETVRTQFLPKLTGWYSTTVKSAAMHMEPASLLMESDEVLMLIDLKFETKSSVRACRLGTPNPHDYWRGAHCSCGQPRGCGRMHCDCLCCMAERHVEHFSSSKTLDDTCNDHKICLMALKVIRRFFVSVRRPARAGAGA